jgi:succinate dehydrogenase / fumarate reductase cytochrome b subunit
MSVASKTITAPPPSPSRLGILWASSVGKKALMALTGILLFLFVLGHLLGNLQLYIGSKALNDYAEFLQRSKPLLWGTRLTLLASVLVHAVAGIQLYLAKQAARPVPYHTKVNVASTPASRTMIWSGILILLFVVYHLLHFTTGGVHPNFIPGDVYHNVIFGFRQGGAALAYLVAMVALGFHLRHGLYSLFSSLGSGNPAVSKTVFNLAAVVATLIALANISFPLAVLAGLGRG